jgi:hypothetical protein
VAWDCFYLAPEQFMALGIEEGIRRRRRVGVKWKITVIL